MRNENFTILIVDDERANIDVLSSILKSEYVVLAAKDGQNAIKVANTRRPDLILLDIVMPGMSGFDVLAELKNSDFTKDIPVIFITGLDSGVEEERGLQLGAVDYITKPFRNSIVKLRVQTHKKIIKQMRVIERLSMIDALTNLPNRRYFDNQLKTEWERAMREEMSISLLMLDIDHFKKYNDTYGHQQGDRTLKTIAAVFDGALYRPADFAVRWGGEEFAVLLPDTDSLGALDVAERIRASVERTEIPCSDGTRTKVTVSIGVNSKIPDKDKSVEDFIQEADKALYDAKNSGRNCVRQVPYVTA